MMDVFQMWANRYVEQLRRVFSKPSQKGKLSFSGTIADFREYLAGWR
jgi:hypothetical protein